MNKTADGNHINQGYIYVACTNHPRTNKDGMVKRGVLVLEKRLGRYLLPTEDVHHINGIRDNDLADNLIALDHFEHFWLHQSIRPLSPHGRPFYGNKYIDASKNKRVAQGT